MSIKNTTPIDQPPQSRRAVHEVVRAGFAIRCKAKKHAPPSPFGDDTKKLVLVELWAAKLFSAADNQTKELERRQWQ